MQLAINRLNEVLGEARWGFSTKTIDHRSGRIKGSGGASGGIIHELTVAVGIWVIEKENVRAATGGAYGGVYADAMEQAIEKAFLHAAAFWGVGKEFYERDDRPVSGQSLIDEPFEAQANIAPVQPPIQIQAAPIMPVSGLKATELISREEAKAEAKKLAAEDGAPPAGGGVRTPPPTNQPTHPDPLAPITELQKQELQQLTVRAQRPMQEFQNFLAKNPNQAQAATVIQTLKQHIKQKEMFVA